MQGRRDAAARRPPHRHEVPARGLRRAGIDRRVQHGRGSGSPAERARARHPAGVTGGPGEVCEEPWSGVFAATLCPFHDDYSIDEVGLRVAERARVTRAIANEVGTQVKVVSGVSAEGSFEAIDHALEAKDAGADAILLMPPHHWLRFGRTPSTAIGFFEDVAAGADI